MTKKLGVCYYPEHWPPERWPEDAALMRELGLSSVRIGEFAWSRLEPQPDHYDWDWFDEAIEILAAAGLEIILGTPTATPPKWLRDRHPEILPVGVDGRVRGFGSRRHYCFSSPVYRQHCRRIVTEMARRYGEQSAVVAWQTDNEYGCHDTVLSYSAAAVSAFRDWLQNRYGTITNVNQAWGTVFWSQEYRSFDQIDLPSGSVTEAHPAHRLDYRRFASDQVASFNREQVEILRRYSPGRNIVHNFMGFFTDFDHFKLAQDLDVATWDSYPLGFLEDRSFCSEAEKEIYCRTGHSDIAAFHHDLYRGVGKGRCWVMEQQPGPVNWAPYNPAPLPGMVRLWTWEAFAHGAELVSYFRWRQAPFAQEQMHAGLNLPDGSLDQGGREARQVAEELATLTLEPVTPAPVALIYDYPSKWLLDIQPQGADFDYLRLMFEWYSTLRQLAVDVDIISPEQALTGYRVVLIPSLPIIPETLIDNLRNYTGQVLIGPRSGSKTASFQIPTNLPPGPLQTLLPIKVTRVESLRPGVQETVTYGNQKVTIAHWRELLESELTAEAHFTDGYGLLYQHGGLRYLAAWPDAALLQALLRDLCRDAGVDTIELPTGLRLRHHGDVCFAFNYGLESVNLPVPDSAQFVLGQARLARTEVAAWRIK